MDGAPDEPRDIDARISDADIERAQRQIGVPWFNRSPFWAPVPDRSSMSHFAFGYGDDNPLWHEPDYGRTTRWRDQVAPPLYLIATGVDETPPYDAQRRELFRGLFRGVGKYYAGVEWRWFRPVYADQPVYHQKCTVDVQVRPSSFSGGRSVVETYQHLYVDRLGEPIGVRHESYVSAERRGSRETGKHRDRPRQRYTPEDIAKIDALYAAEQRRGAQPRWFEDVEVGEALAPIAKGPLTTLDIISMHMGWGWGGYGIGPLRYGWRQRTRMPAFYSVDEYGVPDANQRLHWDARRAEDLGLPAPYDYGHMRSCWLTHLVTHWMGDDAWLAALSCQTRGFNFLGDTHVGTGEVVAKRREGPAALVDLELRLTNQRGEVTVPGRATVILPSRESGPVRLPHAPEPLRERGARMMSEAAARARSAEE
jgi:acyl dehydratase